MVSVVGGVLQPLDASFRIVDAGIIREQQLSQGILGWCVAAGRCLVEPVHGRFAVRYHNAAIHIQLSHEVLRMDIAVLCQFPHIFYSVIPLRQRGVFILNFHTQRPEVPRRIFIFSYDRLSSRYQIDREQYEEQLGYWYDYHHEEELIPQNNVLSGTVIRLQYGEGLLDFIYADFLPEYKKAMENILLLKSFAEIVAEEYFPDRKSSVEQREPEADKVFNCTQEIVEDYFKYASTCFYTRDMSYCSLYSAICPPVFDHDAVADKGLRRYYRYLTMLQKEYLELLEFCFDETYFPEVLGELNPAERYCLYRRLHDQPQVSYRKELFTFSARLMGGNKMPYGMDYEGLLSRLGKARTVTEQQKAFAEKYGVDPEDLINMSTIPHFLHVEYAFHSVADILELEFTKLLEHQVRFRKCGRCGRYFIMKGNYDTRYCDRVAEGTNRTCQDLAAQENYQKKHEDNHAIHIYSKYYKRYSARVRVKQIREDDFKQWKYQAITKRDECSEGKITVEEYIDWMESSFVNGK